LEDTPVKPIPAADNPTDTGIPSSTRKILILWGIIFAAALLGILVCLRPLTEFILLNSPHNYMGYAQKYLDTNKPQKAVDYVSSIIGFLSPENKVEVYALLSRAYDDLGDEVRRDLWRSRAEFEKSWIRTTPLSVGGMEERWKSPSVLAASAARRLGVEASEETAPWLKRLAERMFYAKAKEGAPVTEWISGRTTEQNLGLLLAGGARLLVEGEGFKVPGRVLLQSAGFEQGKGALAVLSGDALIDAKASGYHVVTLNPDTGDTSTPRNFDTYSNRSASERMLEYIDGIPKGWLVLIVTSDEAAKLADPVLVERAIEAAGVELPSFKLKKRVPGYRQSFVGLGTKGGNGTCIIGSRWDRPATLIALPSAAEAGPAVSGAR
jgi:hypothetical protein